MRENKFRGKSIETGEWVYGYYVYTNDRHRIIYEDYEGFYCEEEVDPETVGQYISLKDKKFEEIYEGDIVSYFGFKYEVLFRNGAFGWMEGGEFYSFSEMTPSVFDEFEVIGNVYENPELLEGKRMSDKECEEFVCDYCGTELDETDEYHTTFHTCDKDCYMKMVGLSWSDFI